MDIKLEGTCHFTPEDLVYYKDPSEKKIMSCGFEVSSIMMKKGLPPQQWWQDLAVPAGLLSQKPLHLHSHSPSHYIRSDPEEIDEHEDVISEDVYDRLLKRIEAIQHKKQTKKVRFLEKEIEGGKKNTTKRLKPSKSN